MYSSCYIGAKNITTETRRVKMFGILIKIFCCDEKPSVHKKFPIANKMAPKYTKFSMTWLISLLPWTGFFYNLYSVFCFKEYKVNIPTKMITGTRG